MEGRPETKTLRVSVPHFCCGIVIDRSYIVVRAAPIMKWAVGKGLAEVRQWVASKGGEIDW